jgi:hypothetical protein
MQLTHMSIIYATEALYPNYSFTDIIFKNQVGTEKGLVFLYRTD